MGCDIVVALGRATVEGNTLFGHNCDRPARQCQALHRTPGQSYAPGEKVRTQGLELPQARQTYTVLGSHTYSNTDGAFTVSVTITEPTVPGSESTSAHACSAFGKSPGRYPSGSNTD